MFGRLEKTSSGENLVRRVGRQSLRFSAPIFGRRRRAPTNEGCRRWCLVRPGAWPDSREFPAPEKEAKALASTHFGVSRPRVAIDVPRNFHCCVRTRIVRLRSPPSCFNSSSENALAPRRPLFGTRTRIGIQFENPSEDTFVLPSWRIFAADFVVTLAFRRGQFCPPSDARLPYQTVVEPSGVSRRSYPTRGTLNRASHRRAGHVCAKAPRTPGGFSSPQMRRE